MYGVSARTDSDVWSVGAYTTSTGEERLLTLHYTCGLNPPPPAPAAVSSVSVAVPTIVGGRSTTVTMALTSAAPAGGITVALRSSSPNATVPGNAIVPAGATSASFPVATTRPGAAITVTISASYTGRQATTTIVVTRR